MAEPLQDQAARRQALDPERSYIVQAPAGSGKTGLLTQRFLLLLSRVEQPEQVVAITFTRKAAGEMRLRILEALEQADQPGDDPFQRETRQLARLARDRDRELGWRLLEHPARLRVTTIDALCAALVRQLPVVSGSGSLSRFVEQADALYLEAAWAALAEGEGEGRWAEAMMRLLAHLDHNHAVVAGLLAAMLARRDQWLRHVGALLGRLREDEESLRALLEETLLAAVRSGLERAAEALPIWLQTAVPPLADYAVNNLLRDDKRSPLLAWGVAGEWPSAEPDRIDRWLALAELLLTREGGWRKQVDVRLGFPAQTAGRDKAEKALFKERKEALQAVLAHLQEEEETRLALHAVRALPPTRYDDAQWQVLAALLHLLPMAVAQLKLLFTRRGVADFAEVAQQASQALGEPERPTNLALRLDYAIRHLLVDEFQDTSFNQYRLLERLTAGWMPDDGRTLFLVGDPMQSIYRFREAEVGLFLRVRAEGLGFHLRPHFLRLTVNFRSQAGMVEWVNRVFPTVLPAADDPTVGAVSYAPAVAIKPGGPGPAVRCHWVAEPGWEAEAQLVAGLVEEGLAEGGTVAILVRARRHVARVAEALRAAGLSYQAVEIDPLAGRPVVRDLLALTRALLHPADRIAWLALLRAPCCGLTLADLLVLAGEPSARQRTLWELLNDESRWARLTPEGRQRLTRVRGVLEQALALGRQLPWRRWVEGTWLALGGPATLDAPAQLAEAEAFLALLEGLPAGEWPSVTQLEERVAHLYAPADADANPRLQVMTIHKAKGLEFDCVILPGLGRPSGREEKLLLRWLEQPGQDDEGRLLLAPVRAAEVKEEESITRYVKSIQQAQARHEDGRLLYVAVTRAKRRLHLIGQLPAEEGQVVAGPRSSSLLGLLWPVLEGEWRDASPAGEGGVPDAVPALRWRRLPADWQPPPPPPAVTTAHLPAEVVHDAVAFDWAGEGAKVAGVVVHRFLCRMGREGGEGWDRRRVEAARPLLRAQLLRQGLGVAEARQLEGRVAEALSRTLEDPRGRWLLARHPQGRVEYAVTWRQGEVCHRSVLDRLFVADGVRWIVDYKTSWHAGGDPGGFLDNEQERYRQQLERYAGIMERQAPLPTRLGLYFPLLGGWREWSVGQ